MGGLRWVVLVLAASACGDNLQRGHADGGGGDDDASIGDGAVPDGVVLDDGGVVDGPPLDGDPGDLTPPTIVSITPADGAGSVWLHDRFAITFSEPIAPASVTTQSLRLIDPANQNIAGEVAVAGAVAYVRALDTAAMVGQLRLEVGTTIEDLNGNALASAATYRWTLAPWAKPAAGLAVGATPQPPVVGTATAADAIWLATSVTGRRIAVTDARGQQVGALLGTGNAVTPTIAGTVVAWADTVSSTIQAARWDGASWVALPSPGAGRAPALAQSSNGIVGIAWVDGANDIVTARLVNGAWQASAAPVAATLVPTEPSLSMPADTTLVVGFVDRAPASSRVRVARITGGTVSEQTALVHAALPPAGVQNRVTVSARGAAIVVAWDEYSGHSLSSHVALAAGTSWNILPTIDTDPSGNALAPAVALDTGGAPVVAWIERIEGAHRGFVMRWSGTAWTPVGGHAWTAAPTRAPSRAALELWRDRVPVVAWLDAGATAIEVARFNGPAMPRPGIATRPALAGCAFSATSPPATLTATGCFTVSGGAAVPHAGLVPYDIVSELWSDGALKRRWLALPTGAMTRLANGSLDAPVGSFVIKEFAIGDPGARRTVETRFLARTATGWQGFSYRWRTDGSNADLLAGNSTLTVTWSLPAGGTHDHIYPSRAQCARCHHTSVGPLLGVRPEQLARRFDYDGVLDHQLRVLSAIGLHRAPVTTVPSPAPHDPRAPIDRRVRGYLAVNCAHCHNPAGERPQQDFRLATPLASTGLCDLIVPGDPASSRLYQRDTTRPGMPPIATDVVDPLVGDIEASWISSITSCP